MRLAIRFLADLKDAKTVCGGWIPFPPMTNLADAVEIAHEACGEARDLHDATGFQIANATGEVLVEEACPELPRAHAY